MGQFTGLIGVALFLGIGVLASTDRRSIPWRVVAGGLTLQFLLALLLLRVPLVRDGFEWLAAVFTKLLGFAEAGAAFVFGSLADQTAGDWGFVFAFTVLPVIVFFAALMGVLYHLGVMQRLIWLLAFVLQRALGVSGTEAFTAAANIFVGQTEAPLCVKPFISGMTRSQLMVVMTTGFATLAGSVLAAYVGILGGGDEEAKVQFAKHLLVASLISAPGAIVMAKVMLPERGEVAEETSVVLKTERVASNVVDAAARGATDGMKLALNVAAMLIAFLAMIALIDWPLREFGATEAGRWVCGVLGTSELSLAALLGWLFTPVAWCMGVDGADAARVGSLLGTQIVATEFVAYLDLGSLISEGSISQRSAYIATYGICGFANFASVAIQIGGLSAIAPDRRADFSALAFRAMFAGAMTCWMTGSIAGVLLSSSPN